MVKIKWPAIILVSNLIMISMVVLLFLNRSYPMVGHDYRYAFPQMLDSLLHFRINGLSIQWYTPTFGGGLPAFPNPNYYQFSLITFFALLVQPLQAVMITASIYIELGFNTEVQLSFRLVRAGTFQRHPIYAGLCGRLPICGSHHACAFWNFAGGRARLYSHQSDARLPPHWLLGIAEFVAIQ